jgi:hypothetical protein
MHFMVRPGKARCGRISIQLFFRMAAKFVNCRQAFVLNIPIES